MQKMLVMLVMLCGLGSCEVTQDMLPSKETAGEAIKAESPNDVFKVVKRNIEEKKEAYALNSDTASDTDAEASSTSGSSEKNKPAWYQLILSSLASAILGGAAVYVRKKRGSLPV